MWCVCVCVCVCGVCVFLPAHNQSRLQRSISHFTIAHLILASFCQSANLSRAKNSTHVCGVVFFFKHCQQNTQTGCTWTSRAGFPKPVSRAGGFVFTAALRSVHPAIMPTKRRKKSRKSSPRARSSVKQANLRTASNPRSAKAAKLRTTSGPSASAEVVRLLQYLRRHGGGGGGGVDAAALLRAAADKVIVAGVVATEYDAMMIAPLLKILYKQLENLGLSAVRAKAAVTSTLAELLEAVVKHTSSMMQNDDYDAAFEGDDDDWGAAGLARSRLGGGKLVTEGEKMGVNADFLTRALLQARNSVVSMVRAVTQRNGDRDRDGSNGSDGSDRDTRGGERDGDDGDDGFGTNRGDFGNGSSGFGEDAVGNNRRGGQHDGNSDDRSGDGFGDKDMSDVRDAINAAEKALNRVAQVTQSNQALTSKLELSDKTLQRVHHSSEGTASDDAEKVLPEDEQSPVAITAQLRQQLEQVKKHAAYMVKTATFAKKQATNKAAEATQAAKTADKRAEEAEKGRQAARSAAIRATEEAAKVKRETDALVEDANKAQNEGKLDKAGADRIREEAGKSIADAEAKRDEAGAAAQRAEERAVLAEAANRKAQQDVEEATRLREAAEQKAITEAATAEKKMQKLMDEVEQAKNDAIASAEATKKAREDTETARREAQAAADRKPTDVEELTAAAQAAEEKATQAELRSAEAAARAEDLAKRLQTAETQNNQAEHKAPQEMTALSEKTRLLEQQRADDYEKAFDKLLEKTRAKSEFMEEVHEKLQTAVRTLELEARTARQEAETARQQAQEAREETERAQRNAQQTADEYAGFQRELQGAHNASNAAAERQKTAQETASKKVQVAQHLVLDAQDAAGHLTTNSVARLARAAAAQQAAAEANHTLALKTADSVRAESELHDAQRRADAAEQRAEAAEIAAAASGALTIAAAEKARKAMTEANTLREKLAKSRQQVGEAKAKAKARTEFRRKQAQVVRFMKYQLSRQTRDNETDVERRMQVHEEEVRKEAQAHYAELKSMLAKETDTWTSNVAGPWSLWFVLHMVCGWPKGKPLTNEFVFQCERLARKTQAEQERIAKHAQMIGNEPVDLHDPATNVHRSANEALQRIVKNPQIVSLWNAWTAAVGDANYFGEAEIKKFANNEALAILKANNVRSPATVWHFWNDREFSNWAFECPSKAPERFKSERAQQLIAPEFAAVCAQQLAFYVWLKTSSADELGTFKGEDLYLDTQLEESKSVVTIAPQSPAFMEMIVEEEEEEEAVGNAGVAGAAADGGTGGGDGGNNIADGGNNIADAAADAAADTYDNADISGATLLSAVHKGFNVFMYKDKLSYIVTTHSKPLFLNPKIRATLEDIHWKPLSCSHNCELCRMFATNDPRAKLRLALADNVKSEFRTLCQELGKPDHTGHIHLQHDGTDLTANARAFAAVWDTLDTLVGGAGGRGNTDKARGRDRRENTNKARSGRSSKDPRLVRIVDSTIKSSAAQGAGYRALVDVLEQRPEARDSDLVWHLRNPKVLFDWRLRRILKQRGKQRGNGSGDQQPLVSDTQVRDANRDYRLLREAANS